MAGLQITQINNPLLIREVRSRPCLFIKDGIKHDIQAKRSVWEEVAQKVFESEWPSLNKLEREQAVHLTTKRWSNLRACFCRELRKQSQSSSSKRHKYIYYNELSFLKGELETKAEDDDSNTSFEFSAEISDKNNEDEIDMLIENIEEENPLASIHQRAKETVLEARQERSTAPKSQTVTKTTAPTPMRLIEETADPEMNSYKTKEIDSTNFALSLVPMLNILPIDKRLDAQIDILSILRKYFKSKNVSRKRKGCTSTVEVTEVKSEAESNDDNE